MNTQVKRTAALILLLFLALFATLTYLQFAKAAELRANPNNWRAETDRNNRDRGLIVVDGGQIIARSEQSNDEFGYQRIYTEGPLYAPVTGFFTVVAPPQGGIELAENEVLEGTADSLFWTRVQDLFTGSRPRGGTVELSLLPNAQQVAWDALGDQRGAVVVMDATTGQILVMVSKPSFDPNALAVHSGSQVNDTYQALLDNPGRPLDNRAIAGHLYTPGSTFKLITAAAALQSGRFHPTTELDAPAALPYPNSTDQLTNFGDSECAASGQMSLADALAISCNTAFGLLGFDLGEQVLAQQAEAFGFGQPLDVPLAVTPSDFPIGQDSAEIIRASIGQQDVRVTPLQMAMVAAAIANHGDLMRPQLVSSTRDADLNVLSTTSPQRIAQPMSPVTADQLKEMMVGTVTKGSAARAAVSGLTVGAKTGTAQKGEGQAPDVWTVGFGETENRTMAIAVVVEDGGTQGVNGTGGAVASPIVSQVLQAVFAS
ncbi:MAG: penicillin-binding transpeptidase domain-containing protein [Micrococcales bacterium]|nr:penicillin-binding transpeptidase domain-containing protein [Micrococcales bacterium]